MTASNPCFEIYLNRDNYISSTGIRVFDPTSLYCFYRLCCHAKAFGFLSRSRITFRCVWKGTVTCHSIGSVLTWLEVLPPRRDQKAISEMWNLMGEAYWSLMIGYDDLVDESQRTLN